MKEKKTGLLYALSMGIRQTFSCRDYSNCSINECLHSAPTVLAVFQIAQVQRQQFTECCPVFILLPLFHDIISLKACHQPDTRINPPPPPLPRLRCAVVSFILQKSCTVTSNAPKPLFLFLAHRKLTLAEKPDLLC